MTDERITSNPAGTCKQPTKGDSPDSPEPEERLQGWVAALALGAVLALVVGGLAWSKPQTDRQVAAPVATNSPPHAAWLADQTRPKAPYGAKAQVPAAVSSALQVCEGDRWTEEQKSPVYGSPQNGQSVPATPSKQASSNGLSYETVIPRPTVKGYYEPKVVPYPEGKPVHVNGYFRKDGTYVQPHFRSLPRR
jgi:hypothetical protein